MKKIMLMLFAALPFAVGAQETVQRKTSIYDIMNRRDLKLSQIDSLAKNYFVTAGTGQGSGYKQYQRWYYENQFHLNAQGYIRDPKEEQDAYQQFYDQFGPNSTARIGGAAVGTWTQLGPFTWNATSSWNPGNGRLVAMAIHPANVNTIYVGSPGGGLWKTTNGGTTWLPLTDNNSLWMHIYSIAIDPANQNIIYAGTGNSGNQVIKSTDAGANWTVIGSGPTGEIRKIMIHPTNSNIVMACASNGIFRSTNAGASWTQVHSSYKEDMEFKPGDPNTVYASGNDIVRSTDNGVTWTTLTSAGNGITNVGRTLLAVSPANPNYVYAVQANGNIFGRLYQSVNSGVNFTTKIFSTVVGSTATNNFFGYSPLGTDIQGQASYDMAICVSPTNASEVHIAGIIAWKSINAGTSFVATTEWSYPNATGYQHPDVHGLEFVGSTMYSLSDGGIFKSIDNADNWSTISVGLGISQFYRMASAPTNTTVWTAGAQDNGSAAMKSAGTLANWLGADGMEGLVSPTNVLNIWGTSQNGSLYRSTNGGTTYSNMASIPGGAWVTPLAIHPTTETIVYGGGSGVYKSTNSGGTFTKISGTTISGTVVDLAVAPSDANYIYASVGSTLYMTANGGTTWSTFAVAAGSVTDICISPTTPTKIWITTTSGKVQVSTNSGATFTDLTGSLPAIAARSIVVDNSVSENLYVGMNIGVYTYSNTIPSWSLISSNLPNVAINELDIQKSAGKIRVATYGRGIWEYNFPNGSCTDAFESNNTQATAALINLNTTAGAQISSATDVDFYKIVTTLTSTTLDISLSNLPADYDIQLLNSASVVIASGAASGTTNEVFTASNLAAGTYYIKVFGFNSAFSATQCYNLDVWTALGSCVSAYETNETQATAAVLPLNSTIAAAIGSSTDLDYYKVTTTLTATLSVQLTNLPGDYDLQVLNAAGTVIGSSANGGTTNESVTLANLAAGTYTIKVFGFSGANSTTVCYNLMNSSVAGRLAPGENTNAAILYPNPANEQINIDLSTTEHVSSVIIFDTDGRLVARQDNVANESQIQFDISFLSPGTYFVQLLSVTGELKTMKLVKL